MTQEKLDLEYDAWVQAFTSHATITELTRDVVLELIDKIEVHQDKSITIYFEIISIKILNGICPNNSDKIITIIFVNFSSFFENLILFLTPIKHASAVEIIVMIKPIKYIHKTAPLFILNSSKKGIE